MSQRDSALEELWFDTRIRPRGAWIPPNLRELWRYRGLVYFLMVRDVKVRYKQTALGPAWILLQPLASVVVFTIVFSRVARLPSEGIPYPLFTFAALIPWTLFATTVTRSGTCIVANGTLIGKIYFPRLVIPIANALTTVIDFAVSSVILAVMMAAYRVTPSARLIALPGFALLALALGLGISLWFAGLHVRVRDVAYGLPLLLQMWMFLTPVAYSASVVPHNLRIVFDLNPVTGITTGFRWALFGTQAPAAWSILYPAVVAVFTLLAGMLFFGRTERTFADLI